MARKRRARICQLPRGGEPPTMQLRHLAQVPTRYVLSGLHVSACRPSKLHAACVPTSEACAVHERPCMLATRFSHDRVCQQQHCSCNHEVTYQLIP